MMQVRRVLIVFLVAGSAAAFVVLYPRVQTPDDGPASERVAEEVQEVTVPWPSPPSASPLTSEAPSVVAEPDEPTAAQVFRDINEQRHSAGLASVVLDDTLNAVAHLHADDMARRTYFSHTTPEGVTFEMRIDASGYSYLTASENLGFASHAELIVPDWMRSPPHRSNIEDGRMRRIGVATAQGTWQGIDVVYAVAVFAAPR